ncbi:MAG: hypothetical protein EPO24_07715 [Bacteroidetes bacterium]|nr:MAG: hypothetical protein EPO24_07715 [Bacteroidota bacterium]
MKQKLNKERIIEMILDFYKKNGRVPSKRDFCKHKGYCSNATVYKIFGNWNNAIRSSGLPTNPAWKPVVFPKWLCLLRLIVIKIEQYYKKEAQ